MIELVARAAAAHPERVAVLTHTCSLTYASLLSRARSVAAALRSAGVERFAVVDVEAEVVLPLLAGASLAGAEACVYPPSEAAEIGALAERFEHNVLVSDRVDLAGLAASDAVEVVPTGAWLTGSLESDDSGDALPSSRPHLVLTTGTTGLPRGVRHDWSRLVRGVERVQQVQDTDDDQRWLLAYGLHQFAGLQIVQHVAAAATTLVAPAPRRPIEGLEAMRALGVTHASATPTYWRFLLAQLRSDGGSVPALRQVTLGGEAVPEPLLGQLRDTFPEARISQIYAASEFGSSGSMRDTRAGLSVDVLERGEDAPVDMRIVDGELWVRSATGMLGYHGEPPVDPDAWRPTGDLVEVVGDRVEFRGRSSEIINVGGVKVHPLPVEERVGAVPGVDVARVWGRPNRLTGSIVALEVVAAPGADHEQLRAAIKEACADLPAAARPRSIAFVDQIATLGSKILRREP
ncbi:class I adenylate-forming enzyme family protein [Nocardioides nanhaiensis]|uniref:Long-chain fatty acid--CoA ligase n=1 Tax=Nocardioides nanhaiensis TaxID=1476871 RepID=A0ABP8VV16_9ACTN